MLKVLKLCWHQAASVLTGKGSVIINFLYKDGSNIIVIN